jgi:hypothetical protein
MATAFGRIPNDDVYREMLAEVERYRRELDQDETA